MAYRTPEYKDYFTIDSKSQRDSSLCRAEGGDTQGRLRGRAEKSLEVAWSSDRVGDITPESKSTGPEHGGMREDGRRA